MNTLMIETTSGVSYPVHFGDIPCLEFLGKVMVVTDTRVGALYLPLVLGKIKAKEICVCVIEEGEIYKNLKSVERILETAFLHRLDRKSTMIALGGGVIGDMVGFASGIFMRGIDFIQIPTTLLAQVDASIGGKTGVNHAFGKNLVGVFHQPSAVYIDHHFFETLSSREFRAGVAEIIKMAVTFDRSFFEWLEKACLEKEEDLFYAIWHSVEIKQSVIKQDEKELGLRAALNYGHTFGHAIEKENEYGRYLHGEAVSMGIVMVNELAYDAKILCANSKDRICNLLLKNHLPISYQIKHLQSFYESLFLDKKNENSKIKFILARDIGDFIFHDDFLQEEILRTLKKFYFSGME